MIHLLIRLFFYIVLILSTAILVLLIAGFFFAPSIRRFRHFFSKKEFHKAAEIAMDAIVLPYYPTSQHDSKLIAEVLKNNEEMIAGLTSLNGEYGEHYNFLLKMLLETTQLQKSILSSTHLSMSRNDALWLKCSVQFLQLKRELNIIVKKNEA